MVDPERLFAPLGGSYERAGALLSLGLERGWRRRLIERAAPRDGDLYVDVATGTGLVARGLRRSADCRVVAIDLTHGMLAWADRADGIRYVQGRAERLPFPDGRFDGLTFTYLLRYVDDPVATLRELARVVRPGGRIAMLEFARPQSPLLRAGWWLYTRIALPLLGALVSRDWRAVGAFLGPSIDRFYDRHDMDEVWGRAGLVDVSMERVTLGAAVVASGRVAGAGASHIGPRSPSATTHVDPYRSGTDPYQAGTETHTRPEDRRQAPAPTIERPAFYAMESGSWRDYVTVLHPPYTLWHLSYVVLGAALASEVRIDRLAGTLLAFFLALGVGVHALDEMNGRPLRTRIPDRMLGALAVLGLGGAVALGLAAIAITGPGLLVFIAVGIALALSYPLELARGRLHSDLWFALGWGAFPVLTAAYASGGSITAAALVGAVYAMALSHAQRVLSTWVRTVRRRTDSVSGEMRLSGGGRVALDRTSLIAAPESALRWLTLVAVLVAALALAVRLA